MTGQRRHGHPDFTNPRQQLAVPAGLGQRRQWYNRRCNQLQVQLFQALHGEREIHLLHLAEHGKIRHEQDAARDFLEHFLGQRTAYLAQVQPRGTRQLQGTGADFCHPAVGSLDQQGRRFGSRLLDPALEFLDEGRTGE